jgi:hypothetical protein
MFGATSDKPTSLRVSWRRAARSLPEVTHCLASQLSAEPDRKPDKRPGQRFRAVDEPLWAVARPSGVDPLGHAARDLNRA